MNLEENDNYTEIIEEFKRKWPVNIWEKYGLYNDEFLNRINKHWLKFPPPSKTSHYFLAIFYIIFVIVGSFGNGLVLFMYFKRKSLQTPVNALLANLAISDGMMVILMISFIFNSFNFGPAFGSIGCQFYGFLGGLSGTCSISILATLSLDRYFVTRKPFQHRMKRKNMKLSVIFCWLYSWIFSSIPLLNMGISEYVPEGYLTSCSFDYLTGTRADKIFIFIYFVAAWLLPFLIITFSYVNVYRMASFSKHLRENFETWHSSRRHCKIEMKRRQELKLTLVCFISVLLWFISWTPYAIVALLGITENARWISPTGSMFPALICKTASCLNPFVYAFSHPKFKREITVLFFGEINDDKYGQPLKINNKKRRKSAESRESIECVTRIDFSP